VLGKWRIAPWTWALIVVGVWLALFAGAKLSGNWDSSLSADTFRGAINSGVLEQSSMPQR
jgi:hypothetical protein